MSRVAESHMRDLEEEREELIEHVDWIGLRVGMRQEGGQTKVMSRCLVWATEAVISVPKHSSVIPISALIRFAQN